MNKNFTIRQPKEIRSPVSFFLISPFFLNHWNS